MKLHHFVNSLKLHNLIFVWPLDIDMSLIKIAQDFVYSELWYRNFAQTILVQMLCMTQNTRPSQLEKRYSLGALKLELSVCVQTRNDHKTGVHFKTCNMSGIFFFLVISQFRCAEKYRIRKFKSCNKVK